MKTYEAIKGYSVPVVRVFFDGVPVRTLSFTPDGKIINRPEEADLDELCDAWQCWKESK